LIDWKAINVKEPNDYRFLQRLAMGSKTVFVHLIVPTCLGVLVDEARSLNMMLHVQAMRPTSVQTLILKRQHKILGGSCAKCSNHIELNSQRPYQVALHVFGGPRDAEDDSWQFDFFMGFLCRKCRTMPCTALYVTDETCYMPLAQAFRTYAFGLRISVVKFWNESLPQQERLYAALVEMYRYRFRLINNHIDEIFQVLSDGEERCYYCKTHGPVELCEDCQCVAFCDLPECARFARAAHAPLCARITECRFADVDEICEVRHGVGKPYNYNECILPLLLDYDASKTPTENYERLIAYAPHLADEDSFVESLYFTHNVEQLGEFGSRMISCGRRDVYKFVCDVMRQEEHTLQSILKCGRDIVLYYISTRNVSAHDP
jgi:hypothetical protein